MARTQECPGCYKIVPMGEMVNDICKDCQAKLGKSINVVRLKTHNIAVRDKDGVPIKGDFIELLIPGKPMPKELREMLLTQLGEELGEVALMRLHKLSVMAALGEML